MREITGHQTVIYRHRAGEQIFLYSSTLWATDKEKKCAETLQLAGRRKQAGGWLVIPSSQHIIDRQIRESESFIM